MRTSRERSLARVWSGGAVVLRVAPLVILTTVVLERQRQEGTGGKALAGQCREVGEQREIKRASTTWEIVVD